MKLLVLASSCAVAQIAALADVAWPADFAAQVAANHPAPSGTQIATSTTSSLPFRVSNSNTPATNCN